LLGGVRVKMSDKKKGTVKWYNFRKGYGFIQGDDGEDYFVHFTAVPKGTFLKENDKVDFNAVNTDKGLQAQNIELLQKGSESKRKEQKNDDFQDDEEATEEFAEEEQEEE